MRDDDDGDVDNNVAADDGRGEDDMVELSSAVDDDERVNGSTEIDHDIGSSVITRLPSILS